VGKKAAGARSTGAVSYLMNSRQAIHVGHGKGLQPDGLAKMTGVKEKS
jgi:hypothetical protein